MLQHAESSSTHLKILTSDAVLFSISAWDSVLASTISHCFGHCRIRYSSLGNNPSTSNLELEVITNAVNQLVIDLRYKEPILLEEMLDCPGEESKYSPDDNDIVEMIREESPEPDTDVPLTPSASEASVAIDTYIQYIESKKPYSKKWSDLSHLNEMRKFTQQDEQDRQDRQLTADQVD
ncbi:hypothetical protein K3495_g13251 [Podosphaera aphanis]|nr:hypothetical protein K3495_g13251 [Podosphaera aphanis]